jgi:hypothetical protein
MTKKLTVVIVSLAGGEYLQRCLEAVCNQNPSTEIETVVPCDDRFGSIADLQRKFPEAQVLQINGRRTYAELRSAGFLYATAPIIALTEDQCIPDPDWCFRIVEAHVASHAAIGGAVEKYAGAGDSLLSWAVYFCDYSRYANPVAEGVVRHLTDCNVSYKREALESISHIWRQEFHETVVHAALQQQGKELWLSSKIIVKQQRNMKLNQALRERYVFGRLFGSTRVANRSMQKRIVFAVLALILPLLLTSRVTKNVFEKKRYRNQFLRCLPLIFLFNLFWSVGELVGYLTASADPSLTPRQAPV